MYNSEKIIILHKNHSMDQPEFPNFSLCGLSVTEVLGSGPDKVYTVRDDSGAYAALKILGSDSHGLSNPYEVDVPTKIDYPYIMAFSRIFNMKTCNEGARGIGMSMNLAQSNLRASATRDPFSLKIKYLYQTLLGIKFMHDNGYIHLDVKIDNVLIENGVAKVADFGFTRRVTNKEQGIILIKGYITPAYRPPEIYLSQGSYKYTHKSDVWSIGHMIVELLTSYRFFDLKGHDVNNVDAVKKYLTESFIIDSHKEALIEQSSLRLPQEYQFAFGELLRGCFKHNPEERISVDQILESSIFDSVRFSYLNVKGYIVQSERIQPLDDTLKYIDIMYSYLNKWYPGVDSRLFFCAADIYYRANGCTSMSGSESQLHIMRLTLVGICIWNAIKMIFGYTEREYLKIISYLNSFETIESEYFDAFESSVVLYLKGDMDSKYIYDLCTGKNQLIYCYNHYVRNPSVYNDLNMDEVKSLLPVSDNLAINTSISNLSSA